MSLKREIEALARGMGADLVGVAPVERFANAPLRMSPQGLMPGARSVVVAAIHHPDAAVELGGEPRQQVVGPYAVQYWMNSRLDDISFRVARLIESHGHRALPIASSNIWRYHPYKDLNVSFAPDLVHRYAAVAAGLAEIGWNNLALTPEFGPRARFVSIVTDAALEPTPMYDGPPLCDRCMACVRHCPMDTFRKETEGLASVEIGGKRYEFPQTNKWRCAWAENFDLSLSIPAPEKVTEEVILENLERYGQDGGAEGNCLKFCMVPERRVSDPQYCKAPRRKKTPSAETPAELLGRLNRIFEDGLLDVLAVGRAADFAEDGPVHPRLHLPDAVSVVSVGVRVPRGAGGHPDLDAQVRRRLVYAAMDMAHELDIQGYSAICLTRIHDTLVAERLGVFDGEVRFATVLTSAELPSTRRCDHAKVAAPTAAEIRDLCRAAGADLVGMFDMDRFAAFREAAKGLDLASRPAEEVEDKGLIYGPFVPAVTHREVAMRGPEDWLAGARSVVVLGMHLPDAALDTAKTTPAETVGPYVFACHESVQLLQDVGYQLIRRLNRSGHAGVPVADLTALASTVKSPRGMLPDMRSNRFAALLAGLATIGRNGSPLTPEFGVRQRFLAVVTDLPLPSDPLLPGDLFCPKCDGRCVSSCPTAALRDGGMVLAIEGTEFHVPSVDAFACDWAKRLALSGKEGPQYVGMETDAPVPEDRTASAVAAAVAHTTWGVQKRYLTIGEECIRVCPAKGQGGRASQPE